MSTMVCQQVVNLERLLKRMDIPTHRKSSFNKSNLLWLQKNLGVKNSDNPNFQRAIAEIDRRIEEGDYSF